MVKLKALNFQQTRFSVARHAYITHKYEGGSAWSGGVELIAEQVFNLTQYVLSNDWKEFSVEHGMTKILNICSSRHNQ